jgi:release factor glutamine methyltransferase
LSSTGENAFTALVGRRAAGEPVAYLRGRVEWFDLELEVTPDVLIPRPGTELLLESAVAAARRLEARRIVDVGTGSGAIAIGLARALPEAQILATDVSAKALAVARRNIARYGLQSRVVTVLGSLLEPVRDEPDLLNANLPYIDASGMESLHRDVRHEPAVALSGGDDGLELYRVLFAQLGARRWSVPCVLEIDPAQAEPLRVQLGGLFPGMDVDILPDYSGVARVVVARPRIAAVP